MRSLRQITKKAGFFTRTEALAAGCTINDIRTAVRLGEWRRLRKGAYVFPDEWEPLEHATRHWLRTRAAVHTLGAGVAVSHASGVVAYAIDDWRLDFARIHVTRLDGRSGRIVADVVQHERGKGELELRNVAGIRVLEPQRCVLEAAVHLDPEAAFCLLESGLRSKQFDRTDLETAYAALHARHRMGRLQPLVALAGSQSGSVAESRGLWLFDQAGLPRAEQQWEVRRPDGSLVGAVDWVWHEWRLIVEFDGKVKYSGKFGQTGTDALFAEKKREDEIRELTGYRILRLTWEDLDNPERTVARIRQMVRAAG